MAQDKLYYDEMKRKLRELKKHEIRIRSTAHTFIQSYFNERDNQDLIWNKFFNLKDETAKNVRYSMLKLSKMSKDEFKDVISEYLYYVYCNCYINNGFTNEFTIDTIQLGLPVYADHDEIKRKLKEFLKIYHPDNGGDSEKFMQIMEQYKNFKY